MAMTSTTMLTNSINVHDLVDARGQSLLVSFIIQKKNSYYNVFSR
jgi:hypothetical protein